MPKILQIISNSLSNLAHIFIIPMKTKTKLWLRELNFIACE